MFKRVVTAALVFGTLALAPPVQARTMCAERSVIIERLEGGFHESYHDHTKWEGKVVESICSTFCIIHKELELFCASRYDFEEHNGKFCTFTCNEELIKCNDYW